MKKLFAILGALAIIMAGIFIYAVKEGTVIAVVSYPNSPSEFQIEGPNGWKPMRRIFGNHVGVYFVGPKEDIGIRGSFGPNPHEIRFGYSTVGSIQYIRLDVSADGAYTVKDHHFP